MSPTMGELQTEAGKRLALTLSTLDPFPKGLALRSEWEQRIRAIEAEAAKADRARIAEAVRWLRHEIDAHTDECDVLRRASEGGAEHSLDSALEPLESLLLPDEPRASR